jgi:hypothetical protein
LALKLSYFLPFIVLFIVLQTLAVFPWYIGLVLAFVEFLLFHFSVLRWLLPRRRSESQNDALMKSPYFSAIFQASALMITITWLTRILWHTSDALISNIIFAISLVFGLWHFFRTVMLDPGFVPHLKTREERRQVNDENK